MASYHMWENFVSLMNGTQPNSITEDLPLDLPNFLCHFTKILLLHIKHYSHNARKFIIIILLLHIKHCLNSIRGIIT